TRATVLRRETALDLVRCSDEHSGRERTDGRAPGNNRRGKDADRGSHAPQRGPEAEAGAARGASGPERGRIAGPDRVPGQGHAGTTGPGRAAGLEAGRGGRADRPVLDRPRGGDDGSPGRGGRSALEREGASRAVAGGPGTPGDA